MTSCKLLFLTVVKLSFVETSPFFLLVCLFFSFPCFLLLFTLLSGICSKAAELTVKKPSVTLVQLGRYLSLSLTTIDSRIRKLTLADAILGWNLPGTTLQEQVMYRFRFQYVLRF